MFASELGQNTWDELNEIVPGANYGWPDAEGATGRPGLIDPLQQWPTSEASPSGMVVVDDRIVIANLRGEVLRVVPLADPSRSRDLFVAELGRLRDATIGPNGDVWIVTNNTDGRGEPREGDDRIVAVPVGHQLSDG